MILCIRWLIATGTMLVCLISSRAVDTHISLVLPCRTFFRNGGRFLASIIGSPLSLTLRAAPALHSLTAWTILRKTLICQRLRIAVQAQAREPVPQLANFSSTTVATPRRRSYQGTVCRYVNLWPELVIKYWSCIVLSLPAKENQVHWPQSRRRLYELYNCRLQKLPVP